MSTVSAQGRPRPKPIRIDPPSLSARSLRSRMAFKSPAWTPSSLSPMSSRPLPLYPESGKEERMKEHDKAIVGRLEPRTPGLEPTPLRRVSLRPIAELSLPTPRSALDMRPPLSAPLLPPPQFRRPTIAEETRRMLLFEPGVERGVPPEMLAERRQSAPSAEILARGLAPQRHLENMRRRGLGAIYAPRDPDVLVIPVEHRRGSTAVPSTTEGGLPTPVPQGGRLTIRVVVHSRGRKSVVMTRNFDLDELRATIPDTTSQARTQASRRSSLAVPYTPVEDRRPNTPAFPGGRRHSSGTIHQIESARPSAVERKLPRQLSNTVPMHLEYARAHIPVLAAIILSPIIRSGDTIELPLPYPRAWRATVLYIYTGRVTLTEPIRQNILYLGGKV